MSAVVVAPQAGDQIRRIDSWWRANRPAAPDLFAEELAAAFELVAAAPHAGRRYAHPQVQDVRRILLRSSRFHVYYRVHGEAAVVLAVWNAVRGAGPDLKEPAAGS